MKHRLLALTALAAMLCLETGPASAGFQRGSGFNQGDLLMEKYSIDCAEVDADPSTPVSNHLKLYCKDDSGTTKLYTKDSSGTVAAIGGAAASITSGASPTVDAAGEIAIDTTDDQLVYYGGAKRVLTYKKQAGFTVETPTTADDGVPVFSNPDAITVTGMRCYAVGGTSAEIILTDGTNALDTMTCDADGAVDDGTIANSTFTAGEQMFFNTGTVTGSVTWVNFTFDYTVTAE